MDGWILHARITRWNHKNVPPTDSFGLMNVKNKPHELSKFLKLCIFDHSIFVIFFCRIGKSYQYPRIKNEDFRYK